MNISFLEAMQVWAHCEYLSDLRFLSVIQRVELRRVLDHLPPEAVTLTEWNEALSYLFSAPPSKTSTQAKAELIARLSIGTPRHVT